MPGNVHIKINISIVIEIYNPEAEYAKMDNIYCRTAMNGVTYIKYMHTQAYMRWYSAEHFLAAKSFLQNTAKHSAAGIKVRQFYFCNFNKFP